MAKFINKILEFKKNQEKIINIDEDPLNANWLHVLRLLREHTTNLKKKINSKK